MRPDVSVVIAAYNAEKTVVRAVSSALAQLEVSLEVIVIDDCSTDGTIKLLTSTWPDTVRVIQLKNNGGPGQARNAGIAEARGHWIAILDADDEMLSGRLKAMVDHGNNTGADVVVDDIQVADGNITAPYPMFAGRLQMMSGLTLAAFIDSNRIFSKKFNYGYLKPAFRRDFLRDHNLRYNEALRIGEDYLFMASVLACGARCSILPVAGYRYNITAGSISRVLNRHHVLAMLEGDNAFVSSFKLDEKAQLAQARRTSNLREVLNFLMLVDDIKQRRVAAIAKMAWRNPRVFRFLHMPLLVRIQRAVSHIMHSIGPRKVDIKASL
ncbi:succinoglycan biosynthesis protein ExoO [Phyllobacterium ifriqiyense]|uniref:Succinoglycan biosynthesis protein ExoO n=1 Tax=Phyllobacterium ifriqiyense TaxID=314238 RepID=A0ABU0S3Q8_9HYPH|nr:glycosyltransferase family 2 protein [Phyllobacterium ifriqiyense]MDQ0995401.1 succinoglycan biosynthesis protein ExoO [Phyllobacterium ifriqiyense]